MVQMSRPSVADAVRRQRAEKGADVVGRRSSNLLFFFFFSCQLFRRSAGRHPPTRSIFSLNIDMLRYELKK
jgi:hypothetical protein